MDTKPGDMLLGRNTPVVDEYSPQLLYPIPRAPAREQLGLVAPMPFSGVDIWHAYEMSWLDNKGKPVARVGRFTVPAASPNMVESKSFKLYLHSLNNTRFSSEQRLKATIEADISATAGASVQLELFGVDDPRLSGARLEGECLDELDIAPVAGGPDPDDLAASRDIVEERLYSHLLRSLCPVTGQPDWATISMHYRGKAMNRDALLRYIVSYRQHQEFHEQCVERMFRDVRQCCAPEFLHIQAFYTRRGGLDINPFRSTDPTAQPLPRLDRQ